MFSGLIILTYRHTNHYTTKTTWAWVWVGWARKATSAPRPFSDLFCVTVQYVIYLYCFIRNVTSAVIKIWSSSVIENNYHTVSNVFFFESNLFCCCKLKMDFCRYFSDFWVITLLLSSKYLENTFLLNLMPRLKFLFSETFFSLYIMQVSGSQTFLDHGTPGCHSAVCEHWKIDF